MNFLIFTISFLLTPQYLFAKGYNLEWFGELKHSQSIVFPGNNV